MDAAQRGDSLGRGPGGKRLPSLLDKLTAGGNASEGESLNHQQNIYQLQTVPDNTMTVSHPQAMKVVASELMFRRKRTGYATFVSLYCLYAYEIA